MSYQNSYMGMFPQGGNGNFGFNGGMGGGGGYGGGGGGGGGGGYGGGRGRGRRDDRRGGHRGRGGGGGGDRAPPPPESSNTRMRKMIIKFADEDDFHPIEDPPRLARALRRQWREGQSGVLEGFRVGVTQEPHKHPHFVSLLVHLFRQPATTPAAEGADQEEPATGEKRKAEGEQEPECGREIVEDLSRAFRSWVEGRQWLNMRLCLQFFSLLVPAGLVSAWSLAELYKALLTVLDEVGGGGDRAERVIRAVSEGLIRSGSSLSESFPDDLTTIIGRLDGAISSRRRATPHLDPFCPILPNGEEREASKSLHDELSAVLHDLISSSYAPPTCLPRHWEAIAAPGDDVVQSQPYDLVAVSMPPEMYDVDISEEEAGIKNEGQTGRLTLFAEDVVASPSTVNGWTLRSQVLDIIALFEVNRRECARILLALRQFFAANTFKPLQPSEDESPTSTLSLESLVISTLLNTMLMLPESPISLLYYGSVITELCKLSPNTVAPPVGRTMRRVFTWLGGSSDQGLDCEVVRRIEAWFAVHMSNFGFQWMWKEWVPELELPAGHPKRAFMRRIVDLEVRLAYHDRILETLPEPMTQDASVISDAPDPVWPYEQEDHPLHAEGVELLKLYRAKTPAGDVRRQLFKFPDATSGPGEPLSPAIIILAVETLLHLGSRSFSHFLNATERYLDLLRSLTSDKQSRRLILEAIASYWGKSGQMRLITVDKYLQYGILEGMDVVEYLFSLAGERSNSGEDSDGWTDGDHWELLRMTMDKLVGRVTGIQSRIKVVEREDEMARARKNAERLESGEGVGEDEDVEVTETRLEHSKEARDAQTTLDIQTTKLETALLDTIKLFIGDLLPWLSESEGGETKGQGLRAVLTLLDNGEEGAWSMRARWGWYREFVRRYSKHLTPLAETVNTQVLAGISASADETVEKRAEGMVKSYWDEVIGA